MKTFFEEMQVNLPGPICGRCGATILTFGDLCQVKTGDHCPGQAAINRARFNLGAPVNLKPAGDVSLLYGVPRSRA